jgi:general L-amino acid transport system substrate-binding protein
VVAAAVLGDATTVEFVDLETADRFTALQSGTIDVLIRNTTWTASRDGSEGATFLHPNFYDGQGMMVAADSGFAGLEDMNDAIICVAKGTTTEGNAAAASNRLGLNWEVRTFDDTDQIQAAFVAGQCDGWSSDTSQLTGLRSTYPDGPEALTILPEVFSKEPLAPAVADGDTEWAQAVNWAIFATIQAEEFGITQDNVDQMRESEDPAIRQFLGAEVEGEDGSASTLDPGLGLPVDFAYQVVKQVGNYGEIFERHLAPLGLERGVNALWTDGGLMYAPPYR